MPAGFVAAICRWLWKMAKNRARTQPFLFPQNFFVSGNEQLWEYLSVAPFVVICLPPRAFSIFLYFITSFPVKALEEFPGEDRCLGETRAAVEPNLSPEWGQQAARRPDAKLFTSSEQSAQKSPRSWPLRCTGHADPQTLLLLHFFR